MTTEAEQKLESMRHSLAHVLAGAVQQLYPDAKFGVGPAIEDGFYYDIDFGKIKITEADLPKIEKVMQKIVKANYKFEGREVPIADAEKFFNKKKQPYKLELIKDIKEHGTTNLKEADDSNRPTKVSIYTTGDFEDLCRGGHVESTARVGAFKLHKVAGAYWRGDEKNKMLTRIYGVAFESQREVDNYFKRMEEAEKRDHKKLGKQLGLFFFDETAPGMAYWLPHGVKLTEVMMRFSRQVHKDAGYMEVATPLLNKKDLYTKSGHWDHYIDDMFTSEPAKGDVYGLKPMNCPNAMKIYVQDTHSYRDFPLRLFDMDMLHRYELSGVVNGLLRARSFRQDDAHIFVTEKLVRPEIENILELVDKLYSIFGLEYRFRLGTRPESFMGDIKTWVKAEKELVDILEKSTKNYSIEEGDGAFYGPKIDILMEDALGRDWQMGTIQLDFQIPRKFDLKYTDESGKEQTPVVIHRVLYGSIERFLGILIEHTAGNFPIWLAPEQVRLVTVNTEKPTLDYAAKIYEQIRESGVRVELDIDNESVGKKIRAAEVMKVPYVLVLGEKEMKTNKFVPRVRKDIAIKHPEQEIALEQFIQTVVNETKSHVRHSSL